MGPAIAGVCVIGVMLLVASVYGERGSLGETFRPAS